VFPLVVLPPEPAISLLGLVVLASVLVLGLVSGFLILLALVVVLPPPEPEV